jgi:hypothetical protein
VEYLDPYVTVEKCPNVLGTPPPKSAFTEVRFVCLRSLKTDEAVNR